MKLKERVKVLEQALSTIADHGCGLGKSDPQSGEWETCRDQCPGTESEWCWACIAAEALEVCE